MTFLLIHELFNTKVFHWGNIDSMFCGKLIAMAIDISNMLGILRFYCEIFLNKSLSCFAEKLVSHILSPFRENLEDDVILIKVNIRNDVILSRFLHPISQSNKFCSSLLLFSWIVFSFI